MSPNRSPVLPPHRTAWVAGATGLVGQQLLIELARDEMYTRVIALARRPFDTGSSKVECRVVDFDRLDTVDLGHADDAFCTLGTTIRQAGSRSAFYQVDFSYCLAFAKTALAHGATQLCLVSAAGANEKSGIFYLRVKGEIEHAISQLPFGAVHVLRPSFLTGARSEFRRGERFLLVLLNALSPLLPVPYRPVPAQAVARAMIAAATEGGLGFQLHESGTIQAYAVDSSDPTTN